MFDHMAVRHFRVFAGKGDNFPGEGLRAGRKRTFRNGLRALCFRGFGGLCFGLLCLPGCFLFAALLFSAASVNNRDDDKQQRNRPKQPGSIHVHEQKSAQNSHNFPLSAALFLGRGGAASAEMALGFSRFAHKVGDRLGQMVTR